MSACDTCSAPGHCCRFLYLGDIAHHLDDIEEVEEFIEGLNQDPPHVEINGHLPFRPMFRAKSGNWCFWCPNLNTKTGRCDDYENRPKACSMYEPGEDKLCVLFEEKSLDPAA